MFVVVISKTQMRDCYIDEEGFRGVRGGCG